MAETKPAEYQADNEATTDMSRSELDRLMVLVEVSRSLTSEHDLSDIIHEILQDAIRVIPAADAGMLFLYDPKRRRLTVSHAVGFGPEIYDLTVEAGEGLSGKAFQSGRPAIYPDRDAVMAGMVDSKQANLRRFSTATAGVSFPQSAISAPLTYKGEALGALVVENLYTPRVFGQFDVSLLEALAQVAAIAIVNARLFESERDTRLKLVALNEEARREHDELQKRLSIQRSFAAFVREGLPVSSLATRLSTICKAQTVILDFMERIRGAEPPVTAKVARELYLANWQQMRPAIDQARRTITPQELQLGEKQILISPIAGAGEVFGFILLVSDGRLQSFAEDAVESAGLIVAAAFLKERAVEEANLRRSEDLLEHLLNGGTTIAPSFHGLEPPLILAVGATLRSQFSGSQPSESGIQRAFLETTREAFDHYRLSTTITAREQYLAVLAPGSLGRELLAEILESAAETLHQLNADWTATWAVTDPLPSAFDVRPAYLESRIALNIHHRLNLQGVVFHLASLRAYRLILHATTELDAIEMCEEIMGRVLQADERRGGVILETFRTYLGAANSVTATGKALAIHPHTVQYRLHRLQQLTGMDLQKSEDRLTLELAIRILDLAGVPNRKVESPTRRGLSTIAGGGYSGTTKSRARPTT